MNASKIDFEKDENSLYAAKANLWVLSYEKHAKYINLIEVKHNSLIKQQQHQKIKH